MFLVVHVDTYLTSADLGFKKGGCQADIQSDTCKKSMYYHIMTYNGDPGL